MSNDNNQPNLDLINMVQNARMMHDQSARPSDYAAVYWIEAKRKTGDYPQLTVNTGEWRIKLTVEDVDAMWELVKQATEQGKLGYKSKVSTRPAYGQADPDERLICVRTYDADDSQDVERIKQVLLEIGFEDLEYVRDKGAE